MKILGLIGGISWVSTIDYYTQINQGINNQLGELNYAECIIYSFNFQKMTRIVAPKVQWKGKRRRPKMSSRMMSPPLTKKLPLKEEK